MKTKKHNTDPKPLSISKQRADVERHLNSEYFKCWPISEDRVMILAEDLVLMAKEDKKMISFASWFEKNDLSTGAVAAWRKKFPKFDSLFVQMKHRFTQRIVDKSLTRECDGNFARFILPKCDDSFKELEEWRNNLKKDVASEGSKIIIAEIPTFKSSGLVPDKETI